MVIDNKGKLFGKISIIDILIVAVVILAVAGVWYKFFASKTTSPLFNPKEDVQLTLYCQEAPDFVVNAIKQGAAVSDVVKSINLGKVDSIKIDKAVSINVKDNGEYLVTSKPGNSSFYLTISVKGLYGAGGKGVTIDNSDYYIGDAIDKLRVGDVSVNYENVKVYEIKKKG